MAAPTAHRRATNGASAEGSPRNCVGATDQICASPRLAGRGRRPLGRRGGGTAPRGDPSPLSSPRFRGARTNSFRAPPSVAQTTVSPNDQIHCGEVLAGLARRRGLRLLFFQVAALPRCARERLAAARECGELLLP